MSYLIKFTYTVGLFALTNAAFAMQLTVICQHHHDLNIEYHLYQTGSGFQDEMSDNIKGLQAAYLQDWVHVFNGEAARRHGGLSPSGQPSMISFGFVNSGQTIQPASCQKLLLKENMVITLREDGCSVS